MPLLSAIVMAICADIAEMPRLFLLLLPIRTLLLFLGNMETCVGSVVFDLREDIHVRTKVR